MKLEIYKESGEWYVRWNDMTFHIPSDTKHNTKGAIEIIRKYFNDSFDVYEVESATYIYYKEMLETFNKWVKEGGK